MNRNIKKEFEFSTSEFDKAWNEFFKGEPTPKTDKEATKQEEEFAYWYNNVRKQSDTGKTPAEMGCRLLGYGFDDAEDKLSIEDYIQNGEYADALIMINRLLENNLQDPELLFKKAEVLTTLEKFDDAEQIVDECLKMIPQNPDFYLNKAMIILSRSKFQDVNSALVWINKGLEVQPMYFDLLVAKANYLYWLKNGEWKAWLEKAEVVDKPRAKNFKKNFWLEKKPTLKQVENPGHKIRSALELAKIGDFEKGLEILSTVKELKEIPGMKVMLLGFEVDKLLSRGNKEEAKPIIQKILKINPRDPHAHLYTALINVAENRLEDALKSIDLCIKYAQEDNLQHPDYYMFKAKILEKLNLPDADKFKKMAETITRQNKSMSE